MNESEPEINKSSRLYETLSGVGAEEPETVQMVKREGKAVLDTAHYAQQFLENYTHSKRQWYEWNGIKHCLLEDEDVKTMIYQHLKKYKYSSKMIDEIFTLLKYEVHTRQEMVGAYCRCIDEDGSYKIRINFPNCILVIDCGTGTVTTENHDKKWMFDRVIANNYNPKAQCPLFSDILCSALKYNWDDLYLLGVTLASIFIPWQPWHTHLFLYGRGNTSKSTILNAVMDALGDDLCTTVTFANLGDEKARAVEKLKFKMLNAVTEARSISITDTSIWKALLGWEKVGVDPKYAKLFDAMTSATFITASNHLPNFDDATDADYRRLRILSMNIKIPDDMIDPNLRHKLAVPEEAEGILAFIVGFLPDALSLRTCPKGGKQSAELHNNLVIKLDPLSYYLKEYWDKVTDGVGTTRSIFWSSFRKFLKEQGYSGQAAAKLIRIAQNKHRLKEDFGISQTVPRGRGISRLRTLDIKMKIIPSGIRSVKNR